MAASGEHAPSRLVVALLFGALLTSGWFCVVVAIAPLFADPTLVAGALMLVLLIAGAYGFLHALGLVDEASDYPPDEARPGDADGRGAHLHGTPRAEARGLGARAFGRWGAIPDPVGGPGRARLPP